MAHPQTVTQAFGTANIGYNNVTQGNCVRNVQLCVIDYVWPTPCLTGDNKTIQAVKDFQSSHGLSPADGMVGRDTRTVLWEEYGG